MESEYLKRHWYAITIVTITIMAIIIRLIHLIQNNSFYGDEANLLMNIKLLDLKGLIKGLNYVQACPPAFLIISKLVYENVKNNSSYVIDLSLRILPFICGTASIGLFYIFCKQMCNSPTKKIIAYLIFALNTQTITYSAIFKQYSLELMIALLLYIIGYKIILQNKYKWYYSLIVATSVWFSYSAYFILFPLFAYIIFKRKDIVFHILTPFIISFIIYFEMSLKYIISTTYNEMINCWNGLEYGYLSILHPARTFIRIGEFFIFGATTPHKILTIICGALILYAIILFIFSKTELSKKIFLLTPIILTLTASALHKYPIPARLILFLYPLLTVILSEYSYKCKREFTMVICVLAIVTSLYYTPLLHLPDGNTRNIIEYQKGYLDLTSEEDCIVNY